MKVKVLKKFIDKHDHRVLHQVGEIMDVSEERFSEIVEKDETLIQLLEEELSFDEGEVSKKPKNKASTKKKTNS